MVKKKAAPSRPRTSHRTTRTVRHISRPSSKTIAAKKASAASSHPSSAAKKAPTSSQALKRTVRHKKKASRFAAEEVALLSIVGVCTLSLLVTLLAFAGFNPERDAKNTISDLANKFYIQYFYPVSLGKHLNSPETVLADYAESGLPSVRLRQLLYYNNGANLGSLNKISNDFYDCDPNNTFIQYFPVAPYGPRDYTVKFSYACEDLRK